MQLTQYLTLSVDESGFFKTLYAKQGDYGGREFIITMLMNNQRIIPGSGGSARFRFRKPDRTENWENATINNNGTISFVTSENMLILPGMLYCDVSIVKGQNLFSTATFGIYCDEMPADAHGTVSSDEFLLLQETIVQALGAIRSVQDMIVSAHGLSAGSTPTATITGGDDGDPLSISFGIPKGDKGDALTQNDKQDIADLIGYETQLQYIRTGTTDPSPSLGNEGDIYIKYIP